MSTVVGLTADATVALVEAAKARATHTGTQTSSTISDLTEVVQDLMSTTILPGTNVAVVYNDAAGTFTISSTASGIVEGIALSAYTNGAGSASANTTAIQNAINAANTANKPLLNDLGDITIQINDRINMVFDGFRARFNGLILQQTGTNKAGVRFGGASQDIDGLTVYNSTNPNSSQTNANGFEFTNCLFGRYSNIVALNCARGFYMPQSAPTIGSSSSNTVFSCVFENIRINGWSIGAINMMTWVPGSAASTGNAWINVYCHNNFFGSTATCTESVLSFRAFDENVFTQLNVEWCTMASGIDAVYMQECQNFLVNSVHFEGIALSGNAALWRTYFDCGLTVHAISSVNTTITNNTGQKSIFRGYSSGGNPLLVDVTNVRVRFTQNSGAKPFGLIEIESGSTDADYTFSKVQTGDFNGALVVDPTGVSPSQVNRYNDVQLRSQTFPAVTSTNNIVAPNVWVDKVRTTDAAAVQSTTKSTDSVLQFATTAGTYVIEGMLIYTCPSAGALKLQYNCTGTVTRAKFSTAGIGSNATTQTNAGNYEATAINTDGGWGGAALNEVSLTFRGVLTVSTSGTFSIQYGQYTSTSPGVVVKACSILSYRKIS